MTELDAGYVERQLGSVAQALSDIKENLRQHNESIVDLFKEVRELNAHVASLETVVRMSMADQKDTNARIYKDVGDVECAQEKIVQGMEERVRAAEKRLSYIAGGFAVAMIVLDFGWRYLAGRIP